jgi:hypothetical protein
LNTEGPLLAATLPFKGNSIPNNTLSKTAEPVKLNKNEKREKKKKKIQQHKYGGGHQALLMLY